MSIQLPYLPKRVFGDLTRWLGSLLPGIAHVLLEHSEQLNKGKGLLVMSLLLLQQTLWLKDNPLVERLKSGEQA